MEGSYPGRFWGLCISSFQKFLVLPIATALLLLLSFPTLVYAHPDFSIAKDTFEVAPRSFLEFPLPVHFHRVVGTFEVINPPDEAVKVLLLDEESFSEYSKGQTASHLYTSDRTDSGKINFLIACCQELTYTRYHLVIDNSDSSSSKRVRLDVNLIHDGIAVVAYNGEEFAIPITIIFLGAVGGGTSLYVGIKTRIARSSREGQIGRRPTLLSLGSVAILVSLFVLGGYLALLGTQSYGGSLFDGLVASQALLSLPAGPYGGGDFYMSAIFILPWLLALLLWVKAFGMAAGGGSRFVGGVGLLHGLALILFGSMLASNYGASPIPIWIVSIVGVPLIGGGVYLGRRSGRTL